MKLKSCDHIEVTGLQGLTESCKSCQDLSAKNNNMAVIAAVVNKRLQCCCNKRSLQLAPQTITGICVLRPLAGQCQACSAPLCQHHAHSSTAYSRISTDSAPLLKCTAIMPVRGAADLKAVHRICAVHLFCQLSTALSSEGRSCSMAAASMKDGAGTP